MQGRTGIEIHALGEPRPFVRRQGIVVVGRLPSIVGWPIARVVGRFIIQQDVEVIIILADPGQQLAGLAIRSGQPNLEVGAPGVADVEPHVQIGKLQRIRDCDRRCDTLWIPWIIIRDVYRRVLTGEGLDSQRAGLPGDCNPAGPRVHEEGTAIIEWFFVWDSIRPGFLPRGIGCQQAGQ